MSFSEMIACTAHTSPHSVTMQKTNIKSFVTVRTSTLVLMGFIITKKIPFSQCDKSTWQYSALSSHKNNKLFCDYEQNDLYLYLSSMKSNFRHLEIVYYYIKDEFCNTVQNNDIITDFWQSKLPTLGQKY
jgi:hypothetical protein